MNEVKIIARPMSRDEIVNYLRRTHRHGNPEVLRAFLDGEGRSNWTKQKDAVRFSYMKTYQVKLKSWSKSHGLAHHDYSVKASSEEAAKESTLARFNKHFRRVALRMQATVGA